MTYTPSALPTWQDANQDKQRTLREFLYRYAPADSVKRAEFETELCELLNEVAKNNGCDVGNHDWIPEMGFDNAVLGDVCRVCGVKQ